MIREDGTHLVSGGDAVIREDGTHLVSGETL